MERSWLVGCLCLAFGACADDLREAGRTAEVPALSILVSGVACTPEVPCEVPPVVEFSPPQSDVFGPVRLVRGDLSAYERSRIDNESLSRNLEARLLPLVAMPDGQLAAGQLLEPDSYVLSVPGHGLFPLQIGAHPESRVLRRRWPRGAPGRFAVFCASGVDWKSLCDGALECFVVPGESSCLGFSARPGATVRLPRVFQERWIEPTKLSGVAESALTSPARTCGAGESMLLDECVHVEDDRLWALVQSDAFWTLAGRMRGAFELQQGAVWVLRGLAPREQLQLSVQAYTGDGQVRAAEPTVVTGDRRPHVIINEVLANPLGPEPQQEWVELYNDGSSAVDLGGWRLGDEVADVELSSRVLDPGEYVVIAPEDFSVHLEPRLVPDENKHLMTVPRLGGTGLSNSGERLKLSDETGTVWSAFPPIKALSGVSVARRSPETPDTDPNGFVYHAAPGASPAGPNQGR